jgi:hypothetical protein
MADSEQRAVIRQIIGIGRKRGMPRQAILSALATGSVESRFRNLPGGDRDSEGWRQERAQFYRNPRNVRAAVNRYYDEWVADAKGRGLSIGQQAQAVQQSAFPDRYQERVPLAKRLLSQNGGSSSRAGANSTSVTRKSIPGIDNSDLRQQLMQEYVLNRDRGADILDLKLGLDQAQDVPGSVTTRTRRTRDGRPAGNKRQRIKPDGWKGSRSAGSSLAKFAKGHGLTVTSAKRSTVNTASGNVSDHYQGNRDSYAWDLSGDTGAMDKAARKMAAKLGHKGWRGGILNVNKRIDGRNYRFQLIWNTDDHYDHVHMGVDRLDTPG